MDITIILLIISFLIFFFAWYIFESKAVFAVWDKYMDYKKDLTNKKD
jgi:CBS domain containing-hemolysin-like protein